MNICQMRKPWYVALCRYVGFINEQTRAAFKDLQLAGCAPGHRHGCGTSTANSHGHRQDGVGTKARLEGAEGLGS